LADKGSKQDPEEGVESLGNGMFIIRGPKSIAKILGELERRYDESQKK
jgi:hypothetical protein